MGAKIFSYPRETGLPIGGKGFNKYVMLEVHYNNPKLIKDIVDSSGIEFVITNHVRTFDAGIIELGLKYSEKMAIPGNQVKAFLFQIHFLSKYLSNLKSVDISDNRTI